MDLLHTLASLDALPAREDLGYYVGLDLAKSAGDATPVYSLAGRLYASSSGWILLSVPNAVLHGLFDALDEPGIEKPTRDTDNPNAQINAHVSVMNKSEVEQIGGVDKITERGHMFRYTLGPIKTVEPKTWNGVSKVWYVTVYSPELRKLRKSYGLTSQPNGDWDFHITIAIRKTGVLHPNEKSKAAIARSKAWLITGNPYYTEGVQKDQADKFYGDVQAYLEEQGYDVSRHAGASHTAPEGGDLWVGHSRGKDRLRFAPAGVKTVGLDDYEDENDYDQQLQQLLQQLGAAQVTDVPVEKRPLPPAQHYIFNDAMRQALAKEPTEKSKAAEQLAGGLGDDLSESDVDQKQLSMGKKVELEHTDDSEMAEEIALDHLAEEDDYYTKLKKVEKEGRLRRFKQAVDKRYYGDHEKLQGLLDFIIKKHNARQAGPHFDIRFGGPKGLFSFATRQGLPGPGGRSLLKQTPMHSYAQMDFEGTIPAGYGAGTVSTQQKGQIQILKAGPNLVKFQLGEQPYALVRPDNWQRRDWLLVHLNKGEINAAGIPGNAVPGRAGSVLLGKGQAVQQPDTPAGDRGAETAAAGLVGAGGGPVRGGSGEPAADGVRDPSGGVAQAREEAVAASPAPARDREGEKSGAAEGVHAGLLHVPGQRAGSGDLSPVAVRHGRAQTGADGGLQLAPVMELWQLLQG